MPSGCEAERVVRSRNLSNISLFLREHLHNRFGECSQLPSQSPNGDSSPRGRACCRSYVRQSSVPFPLDKSTQLCYNKAQMRHLFRAGCDSPPAVKPASPFGVHDLVRFQSRQYSLDGKRMSVFFRMTEPQRRCFSVALCVARMLRMSRNVSVCRKRGGSFAR